MKSKHTIDAIKKLKYLKEQISSDKIFKSYDGYTLEKIDTGDAVFLKYWYMEDFQFYTTSALPGSMAGVSGTIGITNNMGICKYIDEKKIKAAAKVVNFIISKEVQKSVFVKNHIMSAIPSLYDDEEVCNIVDCNIVKESLPMSSMEITKNTFRDYDYEIKYKDYINGFLYGNTTAEETVRKIDNILNELKKGSIINKISNQKISNVTETIHKNKTEIIKDNESIALRTLNYNIIHCSVFLLLIIFTNRIF